MIDGTEEDQEFGLEDDSGAVIAAVGRQIKLWREAAGLRAAELGSLIGYSENMVFKVEGGRRIPQPDFLDRTDTAVGAAGKVAAMKKDVEEARYPRKVRDLAKLEAEAVELGAYAGVVIHGLLQTEEYAGDSHRILKLKDGKTVGHNEVQLISGLITDPRQVQILEMRYNLIRSQALTPRLSREFIEKLLGET